MGDDKGQRVNIYQYLRDVEHPDSRKVESKEEVDFHIDACVKRIAELKHDKAPHAAIKALQRWIREWKKIGRRYSMDFDQGQQSTSRPDSYRARKTKKRAESEKVRNRMKGGGSKR